MSIHDQERQLERARSHLEKSGKETLSAVQDIKENVLGIARNIRDTSTEKAQDAVDYVRDQVDDMKTTGTDALAKVEKRIKAKPGQSVAIAFVVGVLSSFLFGRRKS